MVFNVSSFILKSCMRERTKIQHLVILFGKSFIFIKGGKEIVYA